MNNRFLPIINNGTFRQSIEIELHDKSFDIVDVYTEIVEQLENNEIYITNIGIFDFKENKSFYINNKILKS